MIREAIGALVNARRDLSEEEAGVVMDEVMSGEATSAQLAAFLVALRLKGESVDEIVGMARVMRRHSLRVESGGPLLDTCGTGGDGSGSFNVSTAAAFVAAACGARVAKHGNRAVTSGCGSADVLEALGAKIELGPGQVCSCLEKVGFGFMFAPIFHPAMKFAAAPRREIGVRTAFNMLGPITNPAGADAQLVGVADPAMAEKMAQALARLGCRRALVVHGDGGMDELSLGSRSLVVELRDGKVHRFQLSPEELGLGSADRDEVRGGRPEENAVAMRGVFAGKPGPRRDIVVLNAAAAIVAGDLAADLPSGVRSAAEAIDSGAVADKLESYVALTQSLAGAAQ
ncbi:MAG: anthranilate phosphoribosyltransferase [Dehalococcoidia bacterium]|nr:anthranilate phosphoribosyltransferase [Dehalococcoidia bacterium]